MRDAIAKQRTTFSEKEYQATIKQLTDEINQYKTQSNNASQMINRLPRRRGYPANNIVAEEQQELTYYKMVAQDEIVQRTNFLNQLRKNPFDPKARIKADNEVRDRQEALHQGVQDLRKLVEATGEKYATVAKDPQRQEMARHARGPRERQAEAGPVAGVPARRQDAGADRALVGHGRAGRPGGQGDPEGASGEGEARDQYG